MTRRVPTFISDERLALVADIDGVPASGTAALGIDTGVLRKGTVVVNNQGDLFVNTAGNDSAYWEPLAISRGLKGVMTDFRDSDSKLVGDTAGSKRLQSGVMAHGNGIEIADSGLTVTTTAAANGSIATIIATNEVGKLIALSYGDVTEEPFVPSTQGVAVVDVEFTNVSAVTERALFLGFTGAKIEAQAEVATGATTTITLVADDVAGILMDSGLTASTQLFLASNKANAAATQTAASADLLGVTIDAAATYARYRVEVDATGAVTVFKNKVQLAKLAAALTAATPLAPLFYLASNATATKTAAVKSFAAYQGRSV